MAVEFKKAMMCKFSEIPAFDTYAASGTDFIFTEKDHKKLLLENKIISTMPNFEGPNGLCPS